MSEKKKSHVSSPPAGKDVSQQPDAVATPPGKPSAIVGLGASAGGMAGLKSFFAAVPGNSDMAYVVVIHLTPKQPSILAELIQRETSLPVTTAVDGHPIEAGHVYIIPPGKELSVFNGKLQLLTSIRKGVFHPIDSFFRSLALDQQRKAAAVILSGTGTDGTLGIKEIKACEGLVLVQSQASAEYDGMPQSAINTGLVDMTLLPAEMPGKLHHYFAYTLKTGTPQMTPTETQKRCINKIFSILRVQVGHDFSMYKINTIQRRIFRRMSLNQINSHEGYVRYMQQNPSEAEALFRELLIGVTSFFRDPDSFDALKNNVLPTLIEQTKEDETFRAWIPGCSTGEEVYSLAMILREYLNRHPRRIHLQLFGTDIDKFAIDKAREGLFPQSIATDVGDKRLKMFFTKEGNFFRIRKEIRDCVIFSVQDLIKDPPFSRLNLLCCRNLLIYLDTPAQKQLLPLFHYTLKPHGVLMLGSSETIGGFTNLFAPLDKKWKIFKRLDVPPALQPPVIFPSGPSTTEPAPVTVKRMQEVRQMDISLSTQRVILDQFAPTAILINSKGDILHIQGRTGKYLEAVSGPPTQNILNLAREGLRIELSSALRSIKHTTRHIIRENISFKSNGDLQRINLHICPQKSPKELAGHILVVFEALDDKQAPSETDKNGEEQELELSRITALENELQITRENHQITIEELESSNEELKSTNEELQSSNEELQSTNEELESSKEELQSLNEELQTVNAELQSKVTELSSAQDDMRNLLNSTGIATIFVDIDLRIRRFTQKATTIVNLIHSDIGRPLQHVATNLRDYDIIPDLAEVLDRLSPRKIDVQSLDGEWYNMHVMPYRTTDNRIDGAVVTFFDITDQKDAQEIIKAETKDLMRSVFDMNAAPLVVLDDQGKMVIANKEFSDLTSIDQKDIKGQKIQAIHQDISAASRLDSHLQSAIHNQKDFEIQNVVIPTPAGKTKFVIHGRIINRGGSLPYHILLRFNGY